MIEIGVCTKLKDGWDEMEQFRVGNKFCLVVMNRLLILPSKIGYYSA